MSRLKRLLTWSFFLCSLCPKPLEAQEAEIAPLPSPRPAEVRLEKISLEATLDGSQAACLLKYTLYNPGAAPAEVDFLAPLPEGGAVTGLNLLAGGRELPGQVLPREEAGRVYQEIVSRLRDPALLEYAGRDTFRARVFPVPARGRLTLELRLDYLTPKDEGRVEFSFPLAGPLTQGREPEREIRVTVRNSAGLTGLYTPLAGAAVEKLGPGEARVTYAGGPAPVPDRFRLYYQAETASLGGLILSHKPDPDEDGFFLFLAEPALRPEADPLGKNVVFVLDKSGSMSGAKFRQAQEALAFILERLEDRDTFNLVDYNDRVSAWRPEPEAMTPENRRSALDYARNLRPGGATNIEAALKTAFRQAGSAASPRYLVFLTDGQPTAGEKNELKLAEKARAADAGGAARLFAFGLGFDVNARLLDRLSGQSGGLSVFVSPDEDLEVKIASFFSRLTSPALTRPRLTADRPLNRVSPEDWPDLFSGRQTAVCGRYPRGGATVFTLTGLVGGREEKFQYPVRLADGPRPDGHFIAGLWAQRRVGEIIDRIDLAGGRPNPELVAELVGLAKTYGLLTPYTSFLALEDQDITNEDEQLTPLVAANLSQLERVVGAEANAQRDFKGRMKTLTSAEPAPVAQGEEMKQAQRLAELDLQVTPERRSGLTPPRQWGGRTFFFKNGRWQAANLTAEDLAQAAVVRQLSDEYFTLAAALAPEEKVWLAQKEPVIFKRGGRVYLIAP